MADLISREWLLEQMKGLENTTLLKRNFLALVNNAPAEVVRCEDCKHYGGITFGRICRFYSGEYTRIEMPEDGFCFCGERKDND